MYLTKSIDEVFLCRPRSSCRRTQIFIKKSRWMLLMLLTKLTRYVRTQSGNAPITVAFFGSRVSDSRVGVDVKILR